MSEIIIKAENLGKEYTIGHQSDSGGYVALRDVLMRTVHNLWTKTKDFARGKPVIFGNTTEEFWALKDLNFEIRRGEAVGIIGRNGAGKSTLLKVLSRITEPSAGRVTIKGRVASLLEVGTGFHPELTGRENIFLNGAILGMKRSEIKTKFDEIVAFAEVEKFLDTPVKRYSSGMYVRLAFAVAAHLEPEILLVDEVLAVGDAGFQKKCLGKMEDVTKEGRTIVFVSHNMGAIRSLCARALLINSGQLVKDGEVEQVVTNYFTTIYKGMQNLWPSPTNLDEPIVIKSVALKNRLGIQSQEFINGESLTVEISYYTPCKVYKPNFWIAIVGHHGPLFGAGMVFDGYTSDVIEGEGKLKCTFKYLPLMPQTYTVRLDIRSRNFSTMLVPNREIAFFRIIGQMKDIGLNSEIADMFSSTAAPVMVPYEWCFPNGKTITVGKLWKR